MTCLICNMPVDEDTEHSVHASDCGYELGYEDWSCGCDEVAHPECCPICELERQGSA